MTKRLRELRCFLFGHVTDDASIMTICPRCERKYLR